MQNTELIEEYFGGELKTIKSLYPKDMSIHIRSEIDSNQYAILTLRWEYLNFYWLFFVMRGLEAINLRGCLDGMEIKSFNEKFFITSVLKKPTKTRLWIKEKYK